MTTKTPRTDAATELYGDPPFMTPAVPVEFAEQLETENNLLRAFVEKTISSLEGGMQSEFRFELARILKDY